MLLSWIERSDAFGAGSALGAVRFGLVLDLFRPIVRLLDQVLQIGIRHFDGWIGRNVRMPGSVAGEGILAGMAFATETFFR
jgi:hypothetical protein